MHARSKETVTTYPRAFFVAMTAGIHANAWICAGWLNGAGAMDVEITLSEFLLDAAFMFWIPGLDKLMLRGQGEALLLPASSPA